MPLKEISIFRRHGKQYVPDLRKVELTPLFRGRPVISSDITSDETNLVVKLCPTGAISAVPSKLQSDCHCEERSDEATISIDLGKCVFCKECQFALPGKITFTNDYKI